MDTTIIEAGVSDEDIRQLREHLDRKLGEISAELSAVRDDTRRINGKVRDHDQTLYGVDRKGGGLVDKIDRPQWRTIWAALTAVAAFGSIALMAWLGSGAT